MACELHQFTMDMLAVETDTLKQVPEFVVHNRNITKINKKSLKDTYIIDGIELIRKKQRVRFIVVGEFKIHNDNRHVNHIRQNISARSRIGIKTIKI